MGSPYHDLGLGAELVQACEGGRGVDRRVCTAPGRHSVNNGVNNGVNADVHAARQMAAAAAAAVAAALPAPGFVRTYCWPAAAGSPTASTTAPIASARPDTLRDHNAAG